MGPILLTTSGLMVVLLIGLPVAAAIGLTAFGLMGFVSERPLWDAIAFTSWNSGTSFSLMAAPLFVLMGELLLRGGLSEKMYDALAKWLNPIPGGLLHSNIAACSIFAACSGSSVATSATVGAVAMPTFRARGYDERIVLGSLAAGGTLGILIPPSVNLVVYGVLAGVSIRDLLLAALIPGIAMSLLFMLGIFVMALIWPKMAPREPGGTWREKLVSLVSISPMLLVVFSVLGTMYLGLATPTEAAAFGVATTFVLALLNGRLSWRMLRATFESTAVTSAMIMAIYIATAILQYVLASLGAPQAMALAVTEMGLSSTQLILLIIAFYFLLGTFMEAFSMTVATIPIIVPLLTALNVDLVWFGIIVVIMTELALISPPVGMNLFVLQSIRKQTLGSDGTGSMSDVFVGVVPFMIFQGMILVLLLIYPQMALWLPSVLSQ